MIKGIATDAEGRTILILGLSFTDLDMLRADPGDDYIRIKGKKMGLNLDIIIYAGETDAHCTGSIVCAAGPGTKIHREIS